jgi:oligoendopeptidase F
MERKEVPQNQQWKVSDIFPSDEAWEAEYKAVEN